MIMKVYDLIFVSLRADTDMQNNLHEYMKTNTSDHLGPHNARCVTEPILLYFETEPLLEQQPF